jgi:diguanylate cyclase (GGDEF)-like protein
VHPDPVLIVDERRRLRYCNKSALELLDADERQLIGKEVNGAFLHFGTSANEKLVSFIDGYFRHFRKAATIKEYVLESESHWRGALEIRIEPILPEEKNMHEGVQFVLVVLRDVTSQRDLNNQLHYQATHDPLTGLLNRREFENKLAEFIQHHRQTGVRHTFCFIDLNKFKCINDKYGHIAGDNLLKELSERLLSQLRKGDVLGRIGGDEFGLILGGCHDRDALRVLQSIQNYLLNYRFSYKQKNFQITASMGVIDISHEHKSVQEMINMADLACYKAKQLKPGIGGIVQVTESAESSDKYSACI